LAAREGQDNRIETNIRRHAHIGIETNLAQAELDRALIGEHQQSLAVTAPLIAWSDRDTINEEMIRFRFEDCHTTRPAVVVRGRCIGQTCYIRPDVLYKSVDVGSTYYHPEFRGGLVNPAAKHLLLDHAFACGVRRVQFGVDALNARSRAAMRKLGATQEESCGASGLPGPAGCTTESFSRF